MPTRRLPLFARSTPVVAVVHAGPSPGVPGARDVRSSVDRLVAEARTLVALGVDGLLIENTHDQPALAEAEVGHEVVAYLTRAAAAVKRHVGRVPVGVRVIADSGRIALAVAHAVQCPYCIDAYTQESLAKGSDLEQMTEAVHVACAIRGGASLVHGLQMLDGVEARTM